MALQSFGMSGYGKQMDQPFDQSNSGSTVQRTTQSTAADTMASMLIGDYQRLRIDERQQWMDKVAHCEKKIKNLKTEVQDLKDNLEDFAALKAQNGELRGKLEDAEEAANNYKVMYDSAMHKLEELADTSTATLASASVEIDRLQSELAHRTNPRVEKKERKQHSDVVIVCRHDPDCTYKGCKFFHPSRQPDPLPSAVDLLASKASESTRMQHTPIIPANPPKHLQQHPDVLAALRQPRAQEQMDTSVKFVVAAADSVRRRYQPQAGSFSFGQKPQATSPQIGEPLPSEKSTSEPPLAGSTKPRPIQMRQVDDHEGDEHWADAVGTEGQ